MKVFDAYIVACKKYGHDSFEAKRLLMAWGKGAMYATPPSPCGEEGE